MKKFASLILALAMVFSMSIGASATDITSITEGNTDTSVVKIIFTDGAHDVTKYKVTITWDSTMEFTYTKGDERVWDPETHRYSDTTNGSWSEAKTITVNNHSNAEVMASISFDNGRLEKTVGDATVTITCDMDMTNNQITLKSAADQEDGAIENPAGTPGKTLATYTVSPSGVASANNENFGTITIAITEVVTP